MATNLRNFGIVEGRPTRDLAIFDNGDGSRKVKMTVAVQDNYADKDGKKGTQFVNLEAFIPAKRIADRKAAGKPENGVFDAIHKGDLIGVEYQVRTNNYQKNGETVYDQVLMIQTVDLKESKATTDARQAKAEGPEKAPVVAADALPFDAQ